MEKSFRKTKLATSCLLLAVILLTSVAPILPQQARAQFGVVPTFEMNPVLIQHDAVETMKEHAGDPIAWVVVNAILQRIAASTVNWINNGFKGSPAFVTNPDQYFGNLANGIAGQLIYNDERTRFMCAPFKVKVQIALTNARRNNLGQFQCTLTGVVSNFDNFMNDFNQGGWDGFIQITQNSANNPIGLYNSWNNEILNEQNRKLQQKQSELLQGRGFLSFESCDEWSGAIKGGTYESIQNNIPDPEGGFTVESIAAHTVEDQPPSCKRSSIKTPGSVIETQLEGVLSSGSGRLQVADEINEIISALLGQLVSRVVGGIGSGLRGTSGSGSSGGQSYATQLEGDAISQKNENGNNAVRGTLGAPCPTDTANPLVMNGAYDSNGICQPTITPSFCSVVAENVSCPDAKDPSTGASVPGVCKSGACVVVPPQNACLNAPDETPCQIEDRDNPGTNVAGQCFAQQCYQPLDQ